MGCAGGDRPTGHAAAQAVGAAAEFGGQQLRSPAGGNERLQATAGAGGVDAAVRRPAVSLDADTKDAGGRARADPLRWRGVVVTVLGQLADVADREAGELRDALDADAGGAQSGDVLADGTGFGVGVPAAVDPFSGRGAGGGGVGGGAVRAAAAVPDVSSAGAVPVAGLRMGALARHPGLKSIGSATGLLEAAPVLRTRVPPMVRVGESGCGVGGGVAAGRQVRRTLIAALAAG